MSHIRKEELQGEKTITVIVIKYSPEERRQIENTLLREGRKRPNEFRTLTGRIIKKPILDE